MQAPSSSIAWNKLFLLSLFKTSLFWLAALQRFVQQVGGILCSQKETGVWGDHSRNIPSLWQYKEPRAGEKKKKKNTAWDFAIQGLLFIAQSCIILLALLADCFSPLLCLTGAPTNVGAHTWQKKKGNKSPLILLNSIKISLSIHQHCLSENTPPSSSFTIAFATS